MVLVLSSSFDVNSLFVVSQCCQVVQDNKVFEGVAPDTFKERMTGDQLAPCVLLLLLLLLVLLLFAQMIVIVDDVMSRF